MLLVIINSAKRDIYEIIALLKTICDSAQRAYKLLQKMQDNGEYRPVCKKPCKILFPQVCLHRIIRGINPRLILKYLNIVSYV